MCRSISFEAWESRVPVKAYSLRFSSMDKTQIRSPGTLSTRIRRKKQSINSEMAFQGESAMIFDELWRMQKQRSKINEEGMHRIYNTAKSGLEQKQIWDVVFDEWSRYQSNEERILDYRSRKLIAEAERLGLPVPRADQMEQAQINKGMHYLSLEMQTQLRKDIRQERKERREMWSSIVKDIVSPIGSLIISILSLLIAFAALKIKH